MPCIFRRQYILCASLFITTAYNTLANPDVIEIAPSFTEVDLSENIEVFHDQEGKETIESIFRVTNWRENFTVKTPIIEEGVWWLKFTMLNKTGINPVLKIFTDDARLFQHMDSDNFLMQHNHLTKPADQKVFHTHNPFEQFFELAKTDSPTTYCLRVNSVFPGELNFRIRPIIYDPSILKIHSDSKRDQFYLFMGIILLAMVYGMFQLSLNRNSTELYFLFFVICALPTVMQRFGFWYFNVYEKSQFLAENSHFLLQIITMFPIILFTREFLELKSKMPKKYQSLGLLLAGVAVSTVIGLCGNTYIHFFSKLVNSLFAIAIISLIIYCNIILFQRGEKYIRFILVGYVLVAVTSINIIGSMFIESISIIDWPSVGYILIILFYMLAIVDRMNFEKAEKQRILKEQNVTLEKQVKEKTREVSDQNNQLAQQNTKLEEQNKIILGEKEKLEQITRHLKETQSELIVKEKMASLGQLTAGIAHEIKNPLNFINNFADISRDLVEEVKEEIDTNRASFSHSSLEEVTETLDIISMNASKITEHGKRANGIVQNMLRYTQAVSGKKEQANLAMVVEDSIIMALRNCQNSG